MLVNLKEILKIAEEKSIAIGAFNTPNLESILAVLDAAERLDVPVIISHAQLHDTVMPLEIIGPIMVEAAKKAPIPVCVHLDHGEELSYLKKALDLGFTSIMYDGSSLSFAENLANTQKAVQMAKEYNAGVEAELGVMGGRETADEKVVDKSSLYTDPKQAEEFTSAVGIDALACSFGTAHGFYTEVPELDFERIKTIRAQTGIPVVMHGGSGVSPDEFKKAIACGVRKINYYSYMSLAGVEETKALLEKEDIKYFHDISLAATKAMSEDAEKALRVFSNL